MASSELQRRKEAHLDVCARQAVEPPANRTLFDEVALVHDALPELAVADLDTRCTFLGRSLRLPLLITGMTGGTPRAGTLNRQLAEVAEATGVAFGFGSQRPMLRADAGADAVDSYRVRDVAPTVPVLGNLGAWQAVQTGVDGVLKLLDAVGAQGLALHLNVAQELTQPEGDRDFRGALATIEKLAHALGERLVVKETGAGISPRVARRLWQSGVRCFDVSGLGGTSWVRVENLRQAALATNVEDPFEGWGIPTAAAIASVRRALSDFGDEAVVIGSGGVRHGLDVAKAMALGAQLAGTALPLFRAVESGGVAAGVAYVQRLERELQKAMVLTGSRDLSALRKAPRIVGAGLTRWLDGLRDG